MNTLSSTSRWPLLNAEASASFQECPRTSPSAAGCFLSEGWPPCACQSQPSYTLPLLCSELGYIYNQKEVSSIIDNHIVLSTHSPYLVALVAYLMPKYDFSGLQTEEVELIFPGEASDPPLAHLLAPL